MTRPWIYLKGCNEDGTPCDIAGKGTFDDPLMVKHCALHAAAPALLTACKEALAFMDALDEGGEAFDYLHSLMHEAISKAEG